MRYIALLLLFTGIVLPEVAGWLTMQYSPVAHYLSELGQSGAPHAVWVNYGAFLPTGVIVLILLYSAHLFLPQGRLLRLGLILCAGVSAGYIGAAVFPCLPGCPVPGTGRQIIHNFAGITEYAGGFLGLGCTTLGLYRARDDVRARHSLIALTLFVIGVALLSTPSLAAHKGIFQRLADYSFFLWLASLFWLNRTQQEL